MHAPAMRARHPSSTKDVMIMTTTVSETTSMDAMTNGGPHGLTALVAKTVIKMAGQTTWKATLMVMDTTPIGSKPLTPTAMALAITTV